MERYADLASRLGLAGDGEAALLEALIGAVDRLRESVGLGGGIRDHGVPEADFMATLDEMSLKAFDDQCTGANPRYPLVSEIRAMYLEAWRGRREP